MDKSIELFAENVLRTHGVPDVLFNSGGILQNAVRRAPRRTNDVEVA
ncbi:hypothetical protein [Paraburkholderia sp. HD33-4]|nr:hypothetical protein [Paraburkholderia sp. HD33-4]